MSAERWMWARIEGRRRVVVAGQDALHDLEAIVAPMRSSVVKS